jgi:predicted RNA binding protein YcfA (HicA-like mRNA interferase family)
VRLPRDVSGGALVTALRRLGYEKVRQRGSHVRITTQAGGEHHEVVPLHDSIRTKTPSSILKSVARHHANSPGIHALSEITCYSLGWTVLIKRSSRSRIHATASSNSPDEEPSPGNGNCTSRNEGPGRTSFIGLRVGFPDATPAWDSVARCSIPLYGRHPSEPGE